MHYKRNLSKCYQFADTELFIVSIQAIKTVVRYGINHVMYGDASIDHCREAEPNLKTVATGNRTMLTK